MRQLPPWWVIILSGALVLASAPALAASNCDPGVQRCQRSMVREGKRFLQRRVKAVGTCLDRVARDVGLKGGDGSRAARVCVSQLRKLADTRARPRDIETRFRAGIAKHCNPENGRLHMADITGTGDPGPDATAPINAFLLDQYARHFGGDGTIDTYTEWADCVVAAHVCQADQAIALQFPRASEWLELVRASMLEVAVPARDPNRVVDAIAALDAIRTSIDVNSDYIPDLVCGVDDAVVPICHKTGSGVYNLIYVPVEDEAAHRRHGDAGIGETVPTDPDKIFDENCAPVFPSL